MPGFNVSNGDLRFPKKSNIDPLRQRNEYLRFENIVAHNFSLNKFEKDKIFHESDEYILVLDGVIFNKTSLIVDGLSWTETILDLYTEIGETFFKQLRGSFCGCLQDKKKKTSIVFTDHLGTKPIYWYHQSSNFLLSTEANDLYRCLIEKKIDGLDIPSAYSLLSYGYLIDDKTLHTKVKKLQPGHYIVLREDKVTINEYYRLPKSRFSGEIDEVETVNEIDQKFTRAIKQQFDKDKDYGFKHLVALSGGLDSRMTSWVAHHTGYKNQLNFTFSQSKYLDETIPKKIASDLKHEWIFKALDNGLFLKDLESTTNLSGGHALYYGLAHGNSMFKYLNFDNLGLVHSGQLGDVVIGSYIKKGVQQLNIDEAASSQGLLSKATPIRQRFESIEEKEIAMLYQRGLNGVNTGLLSAQRYSETFSPFYDLDFIEYCLSIPIEHRMNHNIYKKWIAAKYPMGGSYVWENTRRKVLSKQLSIQWNHRKIALRDIPKLVAAKFNLGRKQNDTTAHMNPLAYWYNNNQDLRTYQDSYFQDNLNKIDHAGLKADCRELYENGNATEKIEVLSLLGAIKLFFN
jgi:asparagine synthase (glutamine-hydrolysing)